MLILYTMTLVFLMVSLIANPGKTGQALRVALQRFRQIAPAFVVMLGRVAIVL